jgi:hypothetical protein
MTILEKILEKECRVEALRAQIAKLQNDVEILQDAARILSDSEDDNRLDAPERQKEIGRVTAISDWHPAI